jgi:parallel beta-helix repeat protein
MLTISQAPAQTVIPAAATLPAATAATIPISSCGMSITAPGHYVLTGNLSCLPLEAGLYVLADNVDIDLNGFSLIGGGFEFSGTCDTSSSPHSWREIHCEPGIITANSVDIEHGGHCIGVTNLHIHDGKIVNFDVGIDLCSPVGTFGSGAVIKNLRIINNIGDGILLGGYQQSQITDTFVAENGAVGIVALDSQANVFRNNVISSNAALALEIGGDDNTVTGNIAVENDGGVAIAGSRNKVTDNTISDNRRLAGSSQIGVQVGGTANIITGNTVDDNMVGIELLSSASDTSVSHNTALGNSTDDAVDVNGTCGSDVWRNNTFKTRNQACIQ